MSEIETRKKETVADREVRFVDTMLTRCHQDKGFAARLRRADNPATEYQSWEALASFGIDLEKEWQRLPYTTIGAALARSKAEQNGTMPLGRALAASYEEGNMSDQAKAKIRRLLACQDIREACRVLRPLIMLIQSRITVPLDYGRILGQLMKFTWHKQSIKAQWAQEFYRSPGAGEEAT